MTPDALLTHLLFLSIRRADCWRLAHHAEYPASRCKATSAMVCNNNPSSSSSPSRSRPLTSSRLKTCWLMAPPSVRPAVLQPLGVVPATGGSGPVLQPQRDDGSVPSLPTGQRDGSALPEQQRPRPTILHGLPELLVLLLPCEGGPWPHPAGSSRRLKAEAPPMASAICCPISGR